MLEGRRILLVIAGGIAAYKCLDLIRRLREKGASVPVILTEAGARFVTPLSVSALAGEAVHQDLFAAADPTGIDHIRLAREADLVVVAPATADRLAGMACGLAGDLAGAVLLATGAPILVAPAMNQAMWAHPATKANLACLESRGVRRIGPNTGDLACGESGPGRMAEPVEILAAIEGMLGTGPLAGLNALVTSGPTVEPIDPVRFIANRSSGRQGHAIAAALARLGARVTLVSGPVNLPDPPGCSVVHVETAREMLAAAIAALPADVAVCAAAVADWTISNASKEKRKKEPGGLPPILELAANPDILATLSEPGAARPRLVVGFAAETSNLEDNATAKLERKGCDWILANDVSPATGILGGEDNEIRLVTRAGIEPWPRMAKADVALRLARRIADSLKGTP